MVKAYSTEVFPLGVSIVICTYNGSNKLSPTLEHLANLITPLNCELELIVVNNASSENIEDYVKNTWLKLGTPFPLKVLEENRPGKGYAVETGYDAARYSYILTADDDNWFSPDYVVNAVDIFSQFPSVGIVQGQSEGVFEMTPPQWINELRHYFIIGKPTNEPGFFPENDFYVWGAGMVIKKEDWNYLRSLGFSALTSKLPGKAAGEDNEVAIALLMLGRKIYFSAKMQYQHYMPAERIKWDTLKKNFETFGYVSYYFLLYALVLDAYQKEYSLTDKIVAQNFRRIWLRRMKSFTLKQHLSYWLRPKEEYYQLKLTHYYSLYKWYKQLKDTALRDIVFLQSWMMPILQTNPGNFKMPLAV